MNSIFHTLPLAHPALIWLRKPIAVPQLSVTRDGTILPRGLGIHTHKMLRALRQTSTTHWRQIGGI